MSWIEDEQFLRRAIRLAQRGRGGVEPNPMVGCVIVRDGQVIGEGFHSTFGGPHAEPTALANCTTSPEGATAYVTLEPCCHLNKKTPPCAPRLIEAGIARVVVGCLDPNPSVDSRGIAMLRAAGVEVAGPLLEASAKQLIAPFIKQTKLAKPYVTLKWAQSRDKKVAAALGRRSQISSAKAMHAVHQLRARSDVILVGINTAITDNPRLTTRGMPSPRRLFRAVLDTHLRLALDSHLASTESGPTMIFCDQAVRSSSAKPSQLQQAGVQLVGLPSIGGRLSLDHALLHLNKIATHLLVEPGPTLAKSFFAANAVDRLWVNTSANRIDEANAPIAAEIPATYIPTGSLDLDGDTLTEYLNPMSPVFFAAEPSADFLLLQSS